MTIAMNRAQEKEKEAVAISQGLWVMKDDRYITR